MLEKLKTVPANAGLLESFGNTYYDAQQFPTAIAYYQRALGGSYRHGDRLLVYRQHHAGIAKFQKSLSNEPNQANTLFNLGIVE